MLPLIDTNIISELMRRVPDRRVLAWAGRQSGFLVSVITLEELVFGLTQRNLPLKRQWLVDFLASQCEILPVSTAIAVGAGSLRGRLAVTGATRQPSDRLIAATAPLHRLTLATRNTSDFEGCGIPVVNPFVA